MREQSRLYEIDVLRFIAAAMVMLFHYIFRGHAADNLTAVGYPSLAGVCKYGYLGVDLFFMISGFVILMTAERRSAKDFVISRLVRLYPAFWACCTFTSIMTMLMRDPRFQVTLKQYLINLTMLSSLVGIPYVDGVYWSLFEEIKFYLLVFIVLLLRQVRNFKYIAGIWLVLSLLLYAYQIKYLSFILIPEFSSYFIAGSAYYLVYKEGNSVYKTVLITASLMQSLMYAHSSAVHFAGYYHTQINFTVIAVLIAAFYLVFSFITAHKTPLLLFHKYAWLGLLTYPLYLIHQNVGFMLFNTLYPHLHKYVLLGLTCLLVLFVSYMVNIKIEQAYARSFKSLLERFFYPFRYSLSVGANAAAGGKMNTLNQEKGPNPASHEL